MLGQTYYGPDQRFWGRPIWYALQNSTLPFQIPFGRSFINITGTTAVARQQCFMKAILRQPLFSVAQSIYNGLYRDSVRVYNRIDELGPSAYRRIIHMNQPWGPGRAVGGERPAIMNTGGGGYPPMGKRIPAENVPIMDNPKGLADTATDYPQIIGLATATALISGAALFYLRKRRTASKK
ncbi:hypothetical protein [Pasteuria penetrans]|uniref:hypothetical protein n=1 Tax=Pasteuria penetrans TaxID=86005 RepID=UPI0011EBAB30|nr:hypothetical protein [Pasteuria penetrans]